MGYACADLDIDAITKEGSDIVSALEDGKIYAVERCCPMRACISNFQKGLSINIYMQFIKVL